MVVTPVENPIKTAVTSQMTIEVAPTAASALLSIQRPTMMVSAVL